MSSGWSRSTTLEYKVDSQEYLDSRYRKSARFKDNRHEVQYTDAVESLEIPERDSDDYYVVDSTTENRLDLVAHKYYKNPTFWWVIAYANGISDPFNIKTGTLLRIPSYQSIYGYKGVLA